MLNYLLLKDFQLLIFFCCVGFVFSVKRFLFENSTTTGKITSQFI